MLQSLVIVRLPVDCSTGKALVAELYSLGVYAGEGAGSPLSPNNTSGSSVPPYIHVDFPLDGLGIVTVPAGSVISPVFTMWITLVTLYIGEHSLMQHDDLLTLVLLHTADFVGLGATVIIIHGCNPLKTS